MRKSKSIFKLSDILLIVLIVGSIVLSIVFLFIIQPIQQIHALVGIVSLVITAFYIRLLFIRKSELKGFEVVPTKYFDIMVNFGDYNGTSIGQIAAEAEMTVEGWVKYFGHQNGLKEIRTLWLEFKPMPLHPPGQNKVTVTGYTHTTKMFVGFYEKDQELRRTAFSHELGHIIQATLSGSWDEAEHHKRSVKSGLQ